jgi:hypothetical protein
MSKASFNKDDFRSTIAKDSLARTNRFEIYMPSAPKAYKFRKNSNWNLSLYCEQTSIPSLTIATKAFKIFGPSYQRPMTSDYGGDGLAFTFHVDRDMKVRRFFEDWMHLIVDPNTFTVGYQQDYTTSIFVRQLDEQDNITHEIELLEAFPRNMNIMDLSHASSNQTHRLNILFAYRYWVNVDREKSPVPVPTFIQNPDIPPLVVSIPTPADGNLGSAGAGLENPQGMAFGAGGL